MIEKLMPTSVESSVFEAELQRQKMNNAFEFDQKLLKAKIISLICHISEKDCCIELISHNRYQLLQAAFKFVETSIHEQRVPLKIFSGNLDGMINIYNL